MFGYPLAIFLGASAGILIRQRSTWLGWFAAALAAGFLFGGLAAALAPDVVEPEGPLFLALLVWILAACIRLVRPGRASVPVAAVGTPSAFDRAELNAG